MRTTLKIFNETLGCSAFEKGKLFRAFEKNT